jgi:DNA-directed RNA polymerase subunit RPC12/RpoP
MQDIVGANCGCGEMDMGLYICEDCGAKGYIYVDDVEEKEAVDCFDCDGKMPLSKPITRR